MQRIKLSILFTPKKLKCFFLIFFISFSVSSAVTIVDKLSFGTIAILDNTTTSDITVAVDGKTTVTNHIRIIELGQPAHFILSSFPAYTQLFTTANILIAETTSTAPVSQQFTLINLTTAPSVVTNGTGIAEAFIGGTFRTSGSGVGQYVDSLYTANIELSISY